MPKPEEEDEKKKRQRKKLGYRTPDRFRRIFFRTRGNVAARPRSLGGHR